MDNIGDDFNTENIRCNLGFMEHTVINMFYTDNDHQGLKNKDPVVIIHKDDFINIIDELPDSSLKLKLWKILQTGEQW